MGPPTLACGKECERERESDGEQTSERASERVREVRVRERKKGCYRQNNYFT